MKTYLSLLVLLFSVYAHADNHLAKQKIAVLKHFVAEFCASFIQAAWKVYLSIIAKFMRVNYGNLFQVSENQPHDFCWNEKIVLQSFVIAIK